MAGSLDDVPPPPAKSLALYMIVKAQTKVVNIEQAIELAQSIGIPEFRAMASAEAAFALQR